MCGCCGSRSGTGWRLQGVTRYTPELVRVHKCTEIPDPGSCMQVWIPMNDGGRWRLVCIDLDMKTMRTYDPLCPTDDMGEQPPHFQVLRRALASESTESAESTGSTEWTYEYHIYTTKQPASVHQTGVWLLKSLDCHLQKTEFQVKRVDPSKPWWGLSRAWHRSTNNMHGF